MSNEIKFKATVVEDGVEMETELAGSITRELVDAKSRIQDKAIRQWLINQGWTPPEMNSAAPDMYRALRELEPLKEKQYREIMRNASCHNGIRSIDECVRCKRHLQAIKALAKADGE